MIPHPSAQVTSAAVATKAHATRREWSLESAPKVVRLVAGPVSRNAITAPGAKPLASKSAANGVAAVAQM